MRRIVVVGGTGFFGAAACALLRKLGCQPVVASRRQSADVRVDVEDRDSIRRSLRAGDIVLDAAGPFQARTTTLVEAAIDARFDVVDIADSLAFVRNVYELSGRIAAAGIRVATACSSVSAISAAMIRLSGIEKPVRVSGFLRPATKWSSAPATARSLLHSIGRPIEVFAFGEVTSNRGWQVARKFTIPGERSPRTGFCFETPDPFTLPAVFPTLATAEFFASTNVFGLNTVFRIASKSRFVHRLCERGLEVGLPFARLLGNRRSALVYNVEGVSGERARLALTSADRGFIIPVAPAALAVKALAEGAYAAPGLVPPNLQTDPRELVDFLSRNSVEFTDES